jgi:hypothetical protein
MKFVLAFLLDWVIVLLVVGGLVVLGLAHGWDHWYVEPAKDGKWRSCETSFKWSGGGTACSSPISFDEAQWWSATKGGTSLK